MKAKPSTYHMTDAQLQSEASQIKAAQQDRRQFKPLYAKYHPIVFRYIHRRIPNTAIVADLSSETFAYALVHLAEFEYRGLPLSAWLIRIARSVVQMHFRSKKTHKQLTINEEHLTIIEDEMIPQVHSGQSEQLVRALQQLPEDALELIELRFFEQRSFKEIATILSIKETNARVRTHRALQSLKKIIAR